MPAQTDALELGSVPDEEAGGITLALQSVGGGRHKDASERPAGDAGLIQEVTARADAAQRLAAPLEVGILVTLAMTGRSLGCRAGHSREGGADCAAHGGSQVVVGGAETGFLNG